MLTELQVSNGAIDVACNHYLVSFMVVLSLKVDKVNLFFIVYFEQVTSFLAFLENIEIFLFVTVNNGFVSKCSCLPYDV